MDMLDDTDRKRFQRVSISVGQLLVILAATLSDELARWILSLRSPLGDFKMLFDGGCPLESLAASPICLDAVKLIPQSSCPHKA
jgi:hypothetical protein